MQARVNYLSTADVILPRVKFYAQDKHTLYSHIGFLTLQIGFLSNRYRSYPHTSKPLCMDFQKKKPSSWKFLDVFVKIWT